MKSISLRDLKQNLSKYTEEAASGQSIQITKYNKPFIYLTPAATTALHAGSKIGNHNFQPIGKRASQGKILEILSADRNESNE